MRPEIRWPVIIVSAVTEPTIMRRAVDFGASGYIPKSSPISRIGEAVRAVQNGDVWLPDAALVAAEENLSDDQVLAERIASLTPQQFRVLMMIADGLLNKQIAGELDVSEGTRHGDLPQDARPQPDPGRRGGPAAGTGGQDGLSRRRRPISRPCARSPAAG